MNPIKDNVSIKPSLVSLPKIESQVIASPDFSYAIMQLPGTTIAKQIDAVPLLTPSLVNLTNKETQIKNYIDFALSLNPNEQRTQEVLNKMVPGIIMEILQEGETKSDDRCKSQDSLSFSALVAEPFVFQESFITDAPELEIGIVGVNIVSRASSILALKIILDKIQETIAAKKEFLKYVLNEKEKGALEKEIETLTGWVDVHTVLLKELLKESVIETTFSLPKAASAIAFLSEAAHSVVGTVIDWIGIGIGTIGSAFNLYLKNKNYNDHQMWAKVINNKGVKIISIEEMNVSDKETKVITNEIDDPIYKRQKKIFDQRCLSNLSQLDKLLESINHHLQAVKDAPSDEKQKVLSSALEQMKETGIEFSEEIVSIEDLQADITNPSRRQAMNVMMVKKKETLSVSLRNSLKTFNQKKYNLDKNFLEFAENKAMIFFGYSLDVTLASIIIKSLIFTGVIATTSALAILGYGFLALLGGAMGIGAYYLHMKKPNIFKTYLQGVQARLAFWNIPLAIQQYRKNYNMLENIKTSEEIKAIWQKIGLIDRLQFSSNVESLLEHRTELTNAAKKKEKELSLLGEKIKGLNESILNLEERIKPLQEHIDVAGSKDFLMHLHGIAELESDTEIELINMSKRPQFKNDFYVLAEYLLQDATIQEDSETKQFLLHMGIDLSELSDENKNFMIEKLAKQIRGFFAMETDATLKFIEGQKLLEENGL